MRSTTNLSYPYDDLILDFIRRPCILDQGGKRKLPSGGSPAAIRQQAHAGQATMRCQWPVRLTFNMQTTQHQVKRNEKTEERPYRKSLCPWLPRRLEWKIQRFLPLRQPCAQKQLAQRLARRTCRPALWHDRHCQRTESEKSRLRNRDSRKVFHQAATPSQGPSRALSYFSSSSWP